MQSLGEFRAKTMAWSPPMLSLLAGDHFTVTFHRPCFPQSLAQGLFLAFLVAVPPLQPKQFRKYLQQPAKHS